MMPRGYQIRLVEPEDVPLLPQVEWQAARRFLTGLGAPFYQRCGFCIVDSAQLSPQHGELENAEQRLGLRTNLRVSMLYARVNRSPVRFTGGS